MKAELHAIVTPKRNGKKIEATHVYVVIKGPTHNIGVASATLGGNWNSQQGLNEFMKNRKRFTLIDDGMKLAHLMQLTS